MFTGSRDWDKTSVMVNFTCQLDWAVRCPGMGSNVILDVSVTVFFWIKLTFYQKIE